jgi:hypothetical protein
LISGLKYAFLGLYQVEEVKNKMSNGMTLMVPMLNGFYSLTLDVFIFLLRVVSD